MLLTCFALTKNEKKNDDERRNENLRMEGRNLNLKKTPAKDICLRAVDRQTSTVPCRRNLSSCPKGGLSHGGKLSLNLKQE